MELYCKKNGVRAVIAMVMIAFCFWWIFSYSLSIFDLWEDQVTFWIVFLLLGPVLLIGNVMIFYSLAFTVHNFFTLVVKKKPVAMYDDEVFKMYDPLVLKYRVFRWEDIQVFEAYKYSGMSKVQVKLKNPKLVFMYNYLITFKGLSFDSDLEGQELMNLVSELNQKIK